MPRAVSAGVLAYRRTPYGLEFLLVHPGGPFWARKDQAAWSIPKGLVDEGEEPWEAAQREFAEELGQPIVGGEARPLNVCRTPSGKRVLAWLVEADLDVSEVVSNTSQMIWPPRSGRTVTFPEVDRAAYFDAETALWKVHKGQRPILLEAMELLKG